MQKILLLVLLTVSIVFGAEAKHKHQKQHNEKARMQKHVQEAMEKEKKYAKEQTFYTEKNYDFKSAEVNPDSVKNTPEVQVDDLDMDSVYD